MTSIVSAPDHLDDEPSFPEPAPASPAEPTPDRGPEQPVKAGSQWNQREALMIAAQGLTIFGLVVAGFVVYLVGISSLEYGRAQRTLNTAFHRDLNFGNAWIGGSIPEGAPVAQLAIARIGAREIVVEGSKGATLRRGPGHVRASPLPGQAGNSVIAGRRVTYGGPFRHLDRLKRGDLIVTTTGQGRSIYRVQQVREIDRREPDAVDDFGDNRLTLISSAPAFQASRRLVVTATLTTTPRQAPAARPTDIQAAELGLNRDGSTSYALLLWAQALLVASLVTAWLRRRWRRWPTYLVALPVLALLLLLVFDSFAPVLPSTL